MIEQYNDFADIYSDNLEVQDEASIRDFYRNIDFSFKKKIVLDVGCGSGEDLRFYARSGADVYGIDSSQEMIDLAKRNCQLAKLTVGKMENLPYFDEMFDCVLSKYAMQTSMDLASVFSEIARVLKPGGVLLYLTKHPLRQFLEKKKAGRDYFKQEIIESRIFEGQIILHEPSHTLAEYLGMEVLKNFDVISYEEGYDFPASEQISGDTYPCYLIVKALRR